MTDTPERIADPIVTIRPDGTIHTATRGAGLSEVGLGTLVQAECGLPGGSLGEKKNARHLKMLRGPLALMVVQAIEAAGFSPSELVVMVRWDRVNVAAFAEVRR